VEPTVDPLSSILAAPVGRLMRPTLTISSVDTVERAVHELRRNGGAILPVVDNGFFVGSISELSLTTALAEGLPLSTACGDTVEMCEPIAPYVSGSEALRRFSDAGGKTLIVVDDLFHVMGVISPSDLYPRKRSRPNLGTVGGMATPFGVYLTNGSLRGGVSLLAVVTTGMVMFTMLVTSVLISQPAFHALEHSKLNADWQIAIQNVLVFGLFGLMMRLSPVAGTHAAEHMVVHAIERGEELTPEVVARMPRVHPRCGTNLVAASTLFLGIFGTKWVDDDGVRFMVAAIATLFLWKPLGSFAQQYVTTRKPNRKQIESGIKAGNDLIRGYTTARSTVASIPLRFWNSGLLQVISGSTGIYLLLQGISWAFHLKIPGLA